ncbi:L,D-transpeptidase family protein [Nitrobacter hamburgensis]|uniref:L,D-transpeptidase family protein n=1 Tax=Nitrobacter hamburgensis TaxID=912 RepID=UPI0002E86B4B|nr:murein L,D-transpeptidase family protein [Nitrobacter hamburgensis]
MIRRTIVRAVMMSAVLASGAFLAGCNGNDASLASNAKANQPVPPKLVAAMTEKDMELQSPILIRLFKQEAELEVWKQNRSGKFALLKTYPICRWSGDLGPKTREGDRQAPEGFYSISPAQMNPRSAYYLSFNTGYPNAFDKSLGRTGSELMVHGDCSSRGCYAMTDEQIAEIYALGRESFFGGQHAFQFQAYPFHMTPVNLAKHRNNPNMPFWKMIKEGSDHFEVTHQAPKVEFCEHKYVFDPAPPPGSTRPLEFNASAACPAYVVPDDIASAVREKQQRDNAELAKLISKGTPVAKLNTGIDGGMNRVFAAKLPEGQTGLSDPVEPGLKNTAFSPAPGTIPPTVNPPRGSAAATVATSFEPEADVTRPSSSLLAPSPPNNIFTNLASKIGFGAADTTATTRQPAPAKPKTATPARSAPHGPTVAAKHAAPRKTTETAAGKVARPEHVATARPPSKPAAATDAPTPNPGAAPVASTGSFDSRFSAFR